MVDCLNKSWICNIFVIAQISCYFVGLFSVETIGDEGRGNCDFFRLTHSVLHFPLSITKGEGADTQKIAMTGVSNPYFLVREVTHNEGMSINEKYHPIQENHP